MKNFRTTPDFSQFLKVLKREGKPDHIPFYEHIASSGFIARRTETDFDQMTGSDPDYWKIYMNFWLDMGYDCIPMEIPLNCPLDTNRKKGAESHGSESQAVILSDTDVDSYPWPDESASINFTPFETVAALLPDGVKIVGGVGGGPYEWVSKMMGVMGLSYQLADNPDLVGRVFEKIGRLHTSAVQRLAGMDAIGALRQGDDLGFKTSTFLPPAQLREYVFPIYTRMAAHAHNQNKPFILHSCGNLAEVYEDIIGCGIDAKHSFEDVIMPVQEFKKKYGDRITPLGGLDVDFICRASESDLRAYTRKHIEECFDDGYWALGTGNSLTNYMPVENYITVLDEARKIC